MYSDQERKWGCIFGVQLSEGLKQEEPSAPEPEQKHPLAEPLEKGSAVDRERVFRAAMQRALEGGADLDLFVVPWSELAEAAGQELLAAEDDEAFNAHEAERGQVETQLKGERAKRDIRFTELVAADGTQFRTGLPVDFPYAVYLDRRRELERHGRDLEPEGRYIAHLPNALGMRMPEWEVGSASFRNPLVIEWVGATSASGEWRARLSYRFGGKTGKALSRAIRQAGHDAVITIRSEWGEAGEIVDLRRIGSSIVVRAPR